MLEQLHYLLNSCPLLRAFYDETHCLHAPSSSNWLVVEETSVGGYTLKAGHNLMCPSHAQHHLPEYFGKDTTQFNPEWFIEPVLLEKGKPADPKMVRVFGGGISHCSGRFFARNKVLAYAGSVLWRFIGREGWLILYRRNVIRQADSLKGLDHVGCAHQIVYSV